MCHHIGVIFYDALILVYNNMRLMISLWIRYVLFETKMQFLH